MAKPHDNAPASLVPRSNKAKRRQLRERRRAARAVPGPVEVEAPAAREALAHARRHTRNPLKTLARLARGELAARDLPTHSWLFAAATLIEDARGSGTACALAAARLLRQASGLLEADPRVRDVLSAVTRHHTEWVREPEAFRSKTRNGPRRLRALIAHLFERYARSCATGRISIWSVRRIGRTGPQRLATVELDVRTRTVVQARAAANRIPGRRAWALIERWARENRISISRWIPRG